MRLEDAHRLIEPLAGRPFGEFLDAKLLRDLHTNKGNVGRSSSSFSDYS